MCVTCASERRSILRHYKPASVILNLVIEDHQTISIVLAIIWGPSDRTGSAVSASAPLTAQKSLWGLYWLVQGSLSVLGNGALYIVGQPRNCTQPTVVGQFLPAVQFNRFTRTDRLMCCAWTPNNRSWEAFPGSFLSIF